MHRIVTLVTVVLLLSPFTAAAAAPSGVHHTTSSPATLQSLPESLSDKDWMRSAVAIADAERLAPDVRLEPLPSVLPELRYRLVARRDSNDSVARIALAVPPEGVTTAALRRTTGEGAPIAGSSAVPVSVEPLGWIRNVQVVRLSVPHRTGMDLTEGELTVTIASAAASSGTTTTRETDWKRRESSGPVREALSRFVSNPGELERFAAADPAQVPGLETAKVWSPVEARKHSQENICLRVPIHETGFYRIRASDLATSGVPIERLTPSSLRLMLDGVPQPLHHIAGGRSASPGAAGRIHPEDQFLFYGTENPGRYSVSNCYWLVADARQPSPQLPPVPVPPAGAPASEASAFLETARIEQDHPPVLTRNDQFLTILDYRWVWWTWTNSAGGSVPRPRSFREPGEVTFDLPGLSDHFTTSIARAYFYGHAWPTGEGSVTLQVSVNDSPAVELQIQSPTDQVKEFAIARQYLKPAGNKALLKVMNGDAASSPSATAEQQRSVQLELCFDRLEVDYQRTYRGDRDRFRFHSPSQSLGVASLGHQRQIEYTLTEVDQQRTPMVFDVTDTSPLLAQTQPGPQKGTLTFRAAELTTRVYELAYLDELPVPPLAPLPNEQDLHDPSNAADYVIISHAMFLEPLRTFVEAKRAQGYTVQLIDVQHVYDQFSAGQETPDAIREFVRHAVENWKGGRKGPAASCLLLVGDCTSAYRNQFRNKVINYVPTFSLSDHDESERYASDLRFTQVCGDDLLGDSLVGRFSVNNVPDLEVVLAKQEEYARRAEPGPWRNTLVFIADHTEFEKAIDLVMDESVPDPFFRKRIRLADEIWTDNYYFPAEIADAKRAKVSPITTTKIRDAFNEGAAMVTFFGHGSPNIWSSERIWFGGDSENSDNLMLRNLSKLPLIVNMTCNSGAIDYPMPKWNVCISEDFMRVKAGGAVACYVPSGPGTTVQHEKLTLELNQALLVDRMTPLAAGLSVSSWRYLLDGNPPDLVRMFVLLGDPALQLDLPAPALSAADNPVSEWLKGSEMQPCLPARPPALAKAYTQVALQEPSRFLATDIVPLTSAPLAVHRNCGPTGNCGAVPCADLPPMLVPTADDEALTTGSAAAFYLEQNGVFSHWSEPLAAAPTLELSSWTVEPATGLVEDSPVTLTLSVRNTGNLPLRDAGVSVVADSADSAARDAVVESKRASMLPGESRKFVIRVTPRYGVTRYRVLPSGGAAPGGVKQTQTPPIVLAAASSDTLTSRAAALVDPAGIAVRWRRSGAELAAVLKFDIYNVSTYGVSELTAALLAPDGTLLPDTVTTIPAVAPGRPATAEITRSYANGQPPEEEQLLLKLDPFQLRPDYGAAPALPVALGRSMMPDIQISSGSVTLSNPTPTDGETVLFDVEVTNRGRTRVEGVRVNAYDGDGTETRPLESRVPVDRGPVTLEPGETRTVKLRWDPFRNAGNHTIVVKAEAADLPDRNPADNEQRIPLRVLTKHDLRKGMITAAPNREDFAKRRLKFIARLYNRGESPARGVRVVFYPTKERNPADVLGDVIVDEVPAQSHLDVVITYQLKPGEEKRPFSPTFDAFLKGSLQRAVQEDPTAEPQARPSGQPSP